MRNGRMHRGIDIGLPMGVPIRTIGGGVVERVDPSVNDPNGFGNYVVVLNADGSRELFAHLNGINVTVGERIQPGTVIGTNGNSGRSSGPHLHYQVSMPGEDIFSTRTNPIDWMRQRTHAVPTPLGTGPHPTHNGGSPQTPDGTMSLDEILQMVYPEQNRYQSNRVVTGATTANPETTFNNAAPQRTSRAALNRNAYGANSTDHNYGYQALAEDASYRQALVGYANQLNIPAQWLADVIDYETAGHHSPSIGNGVQGYYNGGVGCVGLIQFCPAGGMADLAQHWGVSVSSATQRLRGMSRAEQLRWVHYYLDRYSNGGADLHTIEHLYTLVNGGVGNFQKFLRNPRHVDSPETSDGNGNLRHHFTQLGRRAGRRYESSVEQLQSNAGHVHERPVPGCPECNRMQSNFGTIYPHYDAIG